MTLVLINQKDRIVWLDNLKAFAIFFLFWGHCCGCLTSSLNLFFVAWHMPLFVFASGYTAVRLKDRIRNWSDVNSYIQKLALHIALPNLIYTTIAMAIGYSLSYRWDRMGISLLGTVFFLGLAYVFFVNKLKYGGGGKILSYCNFLYYNAYLVSAVSDGDDDCICYRPMY